MIHDFEGSQKYKMCFGYKQQFDLVSDDGDDRTVLYEIKSGSKVWFYSDCFKLRPEVLHSVFAFRLFLFQLLTYMRRLMLKSFSLMDVSIEN